MKKTLSQINKEIEQLEAAQKREFAKANAKYGKAWNFTYGMMVKEEKKHPEKWKEIQKKYEKKLKKINNEWYFKGTKAVADKYLPKLRKLYSEKAGY